MLLMQQRLPKPLPRIHEPVAHLFFFLGAFFVWAGEEMVLCGCGRWEERTIISELKLVLNLTKPM
jgi:hypothetical protein